MTEVWKSQGRKFCEICKVWFGDNRASIEHHERGMKHQAAVKAKLRDLGKSNAKKALEQAELRATLAAMEEGAHMSMKKNDEGVVNGPALPERGLGIGPKFPVGGTKYLDPRQMSMQSMAFEMERRRKEEEEKKQKVKVATKSSLWRDDEPEESEPLPKDDPREIMWVESEAEDGRKYYFHMFSGATSWEIPDRFFTQKEYDRRLAEIEEMALKRQKEGLPADPTQGTIINRRGEEVAAPPPLQVAKRKKPRTHEEELTAKNARNEESSYGVESAQYASASVVPSFSSMSEASTLPAFASGDILPPVEEKPRFTEMPQRSGPSVFATRKERRKELRGRGELKKETEVPELDEIPLPPDESMGGCTSFSAGTGSSYRTAPLPPPSGRVEEEMREESFLPEPFKKNKEEAEFKAEEEDPEEEETATDEVKKLAANVNPFGSWTKVSKSVMDQSYVAPVSEEQEAAEKRAVAWRKREAEESAKAAAAKAEEPKIEFTEKVAPIMTKKKNVGPVEFKKRSAPNSVRRRED